MSTITTEDLKKSYGFPFSKRNSPVLILENFELCPPDISFTISEGSLLAFFNGKVRNDKGFREFAQRFDSQVFSFVDMLGIKGNFCRVKKETKRKNFFAQFPERKLKLSVILEIFKTVVDNPKEEDENIILFIPLQNIGEKSSDIILLSEVGKKDFRIFFREIKDDIIVDKDTIVII